VAMVGLVVDLGVEDAARYPGAERTRVMIQGVTLPRLAVAPGIAALPMVLAMLQTSSAG
jgi:HPr kinase/phosphorylase